MTTPTNKGLTFNLLPLVTGRDLSKAETLELLEEVEGKTDKGKLFTWCHMEHFRLIMRSLLPHLVLYRPPKGPQWPHSDPYMASSLHLAP